MLEHPTGRLAPPVGPHLARHREMASNPELIIRTDEAIRGGRRLSVDIRDGVAVPGVLLLPAWRRPAPGVLLLHGYSSRKEQMAESMGEALLAHEIASLAIDLPLHGERMDTMQAQSLRNPLALLGQWKLAIREATMAIRALQQVREIDSAQLALVGYSMGSFLGVIVAAEQAAVRAVVLAAGGDLPAQTPFAGLIRTVADPLRSVRRLAGRPLLMVHGRRDRTIRPEQAERLFAAAGEPKELRWWDAGHYLPPPAIEDAARWLRGRLIDDVQKEAARAMRD